MEIKEQTALNQLCNDPDLASNFFFFFIKSPLENRDIITMTTSFRDQLLEILGYTPPSRLVLHGIITSLICSLTFIITCRLLMDKNITFEFLMNYRIGRYIRPYILKLLQIWHSSSILWIYYILFYLYLV